MTDWFSCGVLELLGSVDTTLQGAEECTHKAISGSTIWADLSFKSPAAPENTSILLLDTLLELIARLESSATATSLKDASSFQEAQASPSEALILAPHSVLYHQAAAPIAARYPQAILHPEDDSITATSRTLIYLGQHVERFCAVFEPFATIPGWNTWPRQPFLAYNHLATSPTSTYASMPTHSVGKEGVRSVGKDGVAAAGMHHDTTADAADSTTTGVTNGPESSPSAFYDSGSSHVRHVQHPHFSPLSPRSTAHLMLSSAPATYMDPPLSPLLAQQHFHQQQQQHSSSLYPASYLSAMSSYPYHQHAQQFQQQSVHASSAPTRAPGQGAQPSSQPSQPPGYSFDTPSMGLLYESPPVDLLFPSSTLFY